MSKTVSLTVPHNLSQEEAKRRIEGAIADLRTQYASRVASVQDRWTGNHLDFSLAAMGQNISGTVDVQPQQVRLDVQLPTMLALLAGGFKKRVEDEGRKLLS